MLLQSYTATGPHSYGAAQLRGRTATGPHSYGAAQLRGRTATGPHSYGAAQLRGRTATGPHSYGAAQLRGRTATGPHSYGVAQLRGRTATGPHSYGAAQLRGCTATGPHSYGTTQLRCGYTATQLKWLLPELTATGLCSCVTTTLFTLRCMHLHCISHYITYMLWVCICFGSSHSPIEIQVREPRHPIIHYSVWDKSCHFYFSLLIQGSIYTWQLIFSVSNHYKEVFTVRTYTQF